MTATVLDPPPGPADPLDPVRRALLDNARREATRTVHEAESSALELDRTSAQKAEALRAEARAAGRADADAVLAAERARARRRARSLLLKAQSEVHDELISRVHAALAALRSDPAYAAWRDGLATRARAELGADAELSEHPSGGIVGHDGGRRIALTLDALADEVLAARTTELAALWTR